jgi:DNA-binding transcriptional LysR family regulator
MDRLEAMEVFLAVVDEGSLAGAGRRLGLSSASVTRAVSRLEATAGQRLIERSARRFVVSEAGHRHAASYRAVLAELAKLEASADDEAVSGNIVITAPELFGRLHVMPVIESFLAANPRTDVRALFINRTVDLVGEGVDVAVRIASLPDSTLKTIKLGEIRRLTCAAPSYLARRTAPAQPNDLAGHQCIGLNDAGPQELWPYRDASVAGRARSVRVTCRLTTNSAGAAIDAAVSGAGIVQPLSYQVDKLIETGAVVPILAPFEPDPLPVSLLFRPPLGGNGRAVKAFIDHATPRLRERLPRRDAVRQRGAREQAPS